MPRSFFSPNGVLYHYPINGSASFVPPTPTHTPQPFLQNNIVHNWQPMVDPNPIRQSAPPASAAINPASFNAQPSAPIPSAHAENMLSQIFTVPQPAKQNNPYGF